MLKDSHQRQQRSSRTGRGWNSIAPWTLLSIGSFVGGALLLVFIRTNARLLVSLDLVGQFYLPTIVALDLCATAFLFGVLRSVAHYRGDVGGGNLELGGAVVGFIVLLFVFRHFISPVSNFPLTVFVHGPASKLDLPLRNQGEVLLDIGGDRRSAAIGDKGQAFFPEVPGNFRGRKVNVAVNASTYERTDTGPLELAETTLYVRVQRKAAHIVGNVIDETGRAIAGATLTVAGVSTTSAVDGRFDLSLPSDRVVDDMLLSVSADRYQTLSQPVIPDGLPVTVKLRR
jgi:hypothetical protein